MISFLIACLYLSLLLFKKLSARAYRKIFTLPDRSVSLQNVGIFQPILSGDASLSSTLERNLLALNDATFYWLVDDDDPLAHKTVDALIQRHQDKRIVKLSYPAAPEGINPKLFKLDQVLSLCKQDYCVVLDDDTTLPKQSLQVVLAELTHYELVTGLPQYREQGNFYSHLLAAFVNNNASSTYLSLLPYMEPITINGMCYGFKREQLQKIGGFQPILSCLTDDLAMAEHVLSHGGKIRQLPFTQVIETSIADAKHYIYQMHRWYVFANILFFKQKNKIQVIIFALYGLTPLLLLSILLLFLFNMTVPSFFILIMTLVLRQYMLAGGIKKLSGAMISILSEGLQTLHLLHSLSSKKIRWRNRYYCVDSNSKFTNL